MEDSIQTRILRGIVLLNKKGPENWLDCINLESLDLGNGDHCILGQVYDDYDDGLDELDMSDSESSNYAFTAKYWRDNNWVDLTEAWVDAIRELRGEAAIT